MLIIFDVDGTLVGGEPHDWASFDQALGETLGFRHDPGFFAELIDVTAESICAAAAGSCGVAACPDMTGRIRDRYLALLKESRVRHCDAFPARPGAKQLLMELADMPGFTVAIATGDWLPTISFKLGCAGLDVSRFALATASDVKRRAEIIRLAAERAGQGLDNAVYVGDGVWDLRACAELGIPFIGTGARVQRLLEHGAKYVCPELGREAFLKALARIAHDKHTASCGEGAACTPDIVLTPKSGMR